MNATKRSEWTTGLVIAIVAMACYAMTAAPDLTWAHDGADGGDLISAALTGGVPHPTGYPTYCLLARLFALLPLGSPARRLNLFSSAAAAASAGLLFGLLMRVLARGSASFRARLRISGLVATAWATAYTLWSQATIAEVYALAAFFAALILLLGAQAADHPVLWRWLLLGWAWGLGIGAHLTIALLLPALLVLLWPQRSRRRVGGLILGAAIGLAVFAYLPLASSGNPPVDWGHTRSWEGFWWVVSGGPYRGYLFALPLGSLPGRIAAWTQLWARQYTPFGLALALLGLWTMPDKGAGRWAAASLLVWAATAVYAIGYDTTDSYVYLLPGYLATLLWLAHGAVAIIEDYERRSARRQLAAAAVLVLLTAIPVWTAWRNYRELDLSQDREAPAWLQAIETALPPDALLVTGQDRHTFALQYAQLLQSWRPDVTVVDGELLQYPWYRDQLAARAPALLSAAASALPRGCPSPPGSVAELIHGQLARRPVYLASTRPELAQCLTQVPEGIVWRVSDLSGGAR